MDQAGSLTSAMFGFQVRRKGALLSGRKPISLERVITLSVLSIGLLLGTIGVFYAYWYAKASLRQSVGVTFQELARQSAENVGLLLTREVEWVEQLSALPMVRAAAREGTRVTFDAPDLKRIREDQQRYFTSMVIVDQKGQAVGDAISEATKAHYRQQPWWTVVFDEGRAWGGAVNRDEVGRWYWEVAVPIKEAGGIIIGALKVVIGREQFLDSVLRGRIGRTGHVMLLDERGTVVACTLRAPALHTILSGFRGDMVSEQAMALPHAVWDEVEIDTHQGVRGIVGLAPVHLRPDILLQGRWTLLVQQDPGEMYAPLVTLTERLALFGVAAIGLIVVLRWRLARRIAQPLNALMQRMQTLDLPYEFCHQTAPPPCGIEEIDGLAACFDDLAVRLNQVAQESRQHVHELEEANREIARSEEHYRMLWNHSLHLRLLVDSEGTIRDLNRHGEIKLWRPAASLLGKPVYSLFRVEDQSRLRGLLAEVFAGGKEQAAGEWLVPAPTGDVFVMEVDLVPLEKSGEVDAVMVQLTDLTEKKHMQEQLLHSERLASLSQFASMFAHDIRNPLVGIKKTLELLSDRKESDENRLQQWCADMRFTIDLLLGMINDMLDVYQESYSGLPLLRSTVSLRTLADEVTHLFRTEAEAAQVAFHIDMPKADIQLKADGRRLLRVLINLVHNALKFSLPGGTITVTVREEPPTPHRQRLQGDEVHVVTIQVADEGPGIAHEDLPHVFELFFKKRDAGDIRTGRGLGLHFCRLVMEAHGGRIRAENRASGGAVFSLLLPARQEVYAGQSADC
jgi:PAS domain S-box-containing protein